MKRPSEIPTVPVAQPEQPEHLKLAAKLLGLAGDARRGKDVSAFLKLLVEQPGA